MIGGNMEKKLISIVVPCYNEALALPHFYKEATRVASMMEENDFEFLFVNDGSKDETLEIFEKFRKRGGDVRRA